MMGKSKHVELKLFYHGFSLESRVPADPAVILKQMFLLLYYNVKSERAPMEQLPLRLD